MTKYDIKVVGQIVNSYYINAESKDEAAALHYDKFEDLEKCAGCATIEEIKELEEMETHDANLRN